MKPRSVQGGIRLATLIGMIGLAVAGCGGGSTASKSPSSNDCVIFQNANKLCGDDAVTYCRDFIVPSAETYDVGSLDACRGLGVSIAPTKRERGADALAERDAEARKNAAKVTAADKFDPAIKRVFRQSRFRRVEFGYIGASLDGDNILSVTLSRSSVYKSHTATPALYTAICDAANRVDASVPVVVVDGNEVILKKCSDA